MANTYTIFGRMFGFMEKWQISMKRMDETSRAWVASSVGMTDQMEKMVEILNAQQKAYDRSTNRLTNYKVSLIDLQNKNAAGVRLTAKQIRQMVELEQKIADEISIRDKATEAVARYEAKTNDLNGILLAAESNGVKINKGLKEFVKTHTQLREELSKNEEELRKFNAAQDYTTNLGQIMADTFGVNLFNSIGIVQQKLIGLGKAATLLREAGGVTGLLRQQWILFDGTMKAIGINFGTIMAGMQAGMLSFITTTTIAFAPIVAAIAVVIGAIYTLKTIWKENIGGIQTTFIGVIGRFKNVMAGLDAYFRGVLREWGPQLRPFFEMWGDIAIILIDLLVPTFKLIGFLLKPIFESAIRVAQVLGGIWQVVKIIAHTLQRAFEPVMDFLDPVFRVVEKIMDMFSFIRGGGGKLFEGIQGGLEKIDTQITRTGVSSNSISNNQRFTNQPNIVVYTTDPTKAQQAGQVWGDASSEFTNAAKRNGMNY